MVAEADRAARFEPARSRLPDVVHQRRKPQDKVGAGDGAVGISLQGGRLLQDLEGVLVDVLVAVVFVCFEPERGHLGQHELGEAGVHQQVDAHAGMLPAHEFDQFIADALGRDDADALGHPGHGDADVVPHGHPQLGRKPRGPHHPQGIVGEGCLGGAGGGQHGGVQVADSAKGVHQFHRGQPQGHGVDGEVAAQQVVGEGGTKGHHGLPGLGVVGLGAVGGDFDLEAGLAHADRSEGAADLPEVVRPLLDQRHGLVRRRVRREIEVGGGAAQEEVPDRAADERQLMTGVHEPLPELQDHRVHLEVNGVEISLLMCVRHSYLSLSENQPPTAPNPVIVRRRRQSPSHAVHLEAMFRSSRRGKSR